MEIREIVEEIIMQKKESGGLKNIYFVACGGSLGSFYPAKYFLETEAGELKAGWFNSNEFVHNTPKGFGEQAVLITASHKGNTPETVKAAQIAKEQGVPVIALTWIQDSPITKYADYVVTYSFGEGKDIGREKTIQSLLLAVEFLQQTEGYINYKAFQEGVNRIDRIVKNACKLVQRRAGEFAAEHKDDEVIYTVGSGAGYGAAYMECICIFMEMQWINSNAIHSGEYFHGPFEITDKEIPFVLQLSEGKTRELDERALRFLEQYGKRIEVLDAKELGLSVIDSSVVDYFNHSLYNNVYVVYNEALAKERQHPLSTRRYMWKVEY